MACFGLKEAQLLVVDTLVQTRIHNQQFIATLWIFSTRAVAYGAQLLSALLDLFLLRHHCRIKGWRYSQAGMQVCFCCLRGDGIARCVSVAIG